MHLGETHKLSGPGFDPRPQDHLDFRRETGAHLPRITWGVLVADHTESQASWLPRCINCVSFFGFGSVGLRLSTHFGQICLTFGPFVSHRCAAGGCVSFFWFWLSGVVFVYAFWSNLSDFWPISVSQMHCRWVCFFLQTKYHN